MDANLDTNAEGVEAHESFTVLATLSDFFDVTFPPTYLLAMFQIFPTFALL